jgi:hypothetical protein
MSLHWLANLTSTPPGHPSLTRVDEQTLAIASVSVDGDHVSRVIMLVHAAEVLKLLASLMIESYVGMS